MMSIVDALKTDSSAKMLLLIEHKADVHYINPKNFLTPLLFLLLLKECLTEDQAKNSERIVNLLVDQGARIISPSVLQALEMVKCAQTSGRRAIKRGTPSKS